ncbi:EamA family transporter RarD [Devosia sp.]|uniref:EamA family transporter RarD n=1 Tax=Devosia sp. TaxID=1871048 RepID=UPI003A8E11AC
MASVTVHEKPGEYGLVAGLASYLLWGFLPLLFDALEPAGSITIVANRTIWSVLFVGAILIVGGRTKEVRAVLRDGKAVRTMALSALVLGLNWLVFIYAVESGQLLEGSFGYFINPLVSVAVGMALLGEKLNRWQAVSVGIAVIGIGIQAAGLGNIPFIALTLAFSFAIYGYLRKTAQASSATGLFVETLLMSPLAIGYLTYGLIRDGGLGAQGEPTIMVLLMLTGPATAIPLLLFAYAAQRLRLATIGMLQYLAPSIAFLLAIFVMGEHLNTTRLVSFGFIWFSLAVYTADSIIRRRRARVPVPPPSTA